MPVGDDRILLSSDGGSMVGLGRPITLRDWHLAQVDLPRAGVGTVLRTLAKAAPALDGLAERLACTDGTSIALLGVHNLIIVRTPDAVLICHRHQAEKIKNLVGKLPEALQ